MQKQIIIKRLISFNLISGFTILIFTLTNIILSFAIFLAINKLGLKDWIINQPRIKVLFSLGLLVFVVMTTILFISDKFVNDKTKKWLPKINPVFLLILSFILLVIVLGGGYILSLEFYVFLKDRFWK